MADSDILRSVARQYGASLAMLGQAIEKCPASLWLSTECPNRFWHIAYHAIFYTSYYLQVSEHNPPAWPKVRPDHQYLGPRPWAPQAPAIMPEPYSKADLLEFHALCCAEVDGKVPHLDLTAPAGFSWLPFSKLELQLYNLRHVQHHTGQLLDRLRSKANIGIGWVRPE